MSFIKLTSMIINTKYITTILLKPSKYYIYIANHNINGFMLLGSGGLNSGKTEIKVCANKNPVDYKTVSDWIEHMKP